MRTRVSVLALSVLAGGCAPSRPAGPPAPAARPRDLLIVWADAEPDDGEAPLTVQLECDPLEKIESPTFYWDFGDGSSPSKEQNPKHTYTRSGTYVARVAMTNPQGQAGDDTVRVDVEAPSDGKGRRER